MIVLTNVGGPVSRAHKDDIRNDLGIIVVSFDRQTYPAYLEPSEATTRTFSDHFLLANFDTFSHSFFSRRLVVAIVMMAVFHDMVIP